MKFVFLMIIFVYCGVEIVYPNGSFEQSMSLIESEKGLHYLIYDSTEHKKGVSKSVIVEMEDFLVMIELPLSDLGGNAKVLVDNVSESSKVISFMDNKFAGKRIKFLLSSHWHPHSIAAISPLIDNGTKIITTRKNFSRIREMLDSNRVEKYLESVIFVDETMKIGVEGSRIVIERLDRSIYPYLSTDDFLFFYLEKYELLHVACMHYQYEGWKAFDREIIYPRCSDTYDYISRKGIEPLGLIRISADMNELKNVIPFEKLKSYVEKGISFKEMSEMVKMITVSTFQTQQDSIVKWVLGNKMPFSILNSAAIDCMKSRELDKAVEIAKLQAMLNPTNANSWDTLGEAYYFKGEIDVAKHIGSKSKLIDSNYTSGGIEVWAKDLKEASEKWKEK